MPGGRSHVTKRMPARQYTVFFIADEEAGGFTAHVPALGIVTEGRTLREARVMARDAIRGRIAVLRELGELVPRDIQPEKLTVRV